MQHVVRELKGFTKVALEPGETVRATFELDARALSYYEPALYDFFAESGSYGIEVGASSRDICLTGTVAYTAQRAIPRVFDRYALVSAITETDAGREAFCGLLDAMGSSMGLDGGELGAMSAEVLFSGMPLASLVSFDMLTEEQLDDLLMRVNAGQ